METLFLVTYFYENDEGMSDRDYALFATEEKMLNGIEDIKEYNRKVVINRAMEILVKKEFDL